jgi:RHS repeat-associated protein
VTGYVYDALGNLLTVRLPDGTQVDYVIDGLSRRIGRKVNGTLIQGFVYDERGRVVAELDGTGIVVSRFVYASQPTVPDYMVRGGVEYRLVTDHLGSVRLVVRSDNGTIVQRIDYDAFGVVTTDTAPGFQPFGFAGGVYDPQTRLVRFGTRDYDAETGRWTTRDPILFASGRTNLYVYAAADPVNLQDTTGLDDTPGNGGVCLGPPPDLNLPKPKVSDPKPDLPPPPFCPTCATPDEKAQHVQDKPVGPRLPSNEPAASSGGGGGGPSLPSLSLRIGPFSFSFSGGKPDVGALRDKGPEKAFKDGGLKVDGSLDPGFGLSDKPAGGPDPNGPNPKPQGPQCKPALDKPDPLGCEN